MSRNPNPNSFGHLSMNLNGLGPATLPYICIAPTMSAWLGDCFAWARVPWVATFSETNATRSRTEVCKDPRSRGAAFSSWNWAVHRPSPVSGPEILDFARAPSKISRPCAKCNISPNALGFRVGATKVEGRGREINIIKISKIIKMFKVGTRF